MAQKNVLRPLSEWLTSYQNVSGQGLPFTHTSLVGGSYDVTKLDKYLRNNEVKGRSGRQLDQLSDAEKRTRIAKQEDNFIKNYARTTANILYRKRKIKESTGIDRNKIRHDLNFISEKATPVYKFFIDFDFAASDDLAMEGFSSEVQIARRIGTLKEKQKNPRRQSDHRITRRQEKLSLFEKCQKLSNHQRLLNLVRFVQSSLKDFYPGLVRKSPKSFTVLICLTTPKKIKNGGYGEGVHLVFPYLEVNSEQALNIRATMIYRLNAHAEFGNRPEDNSWRKVFDEGVYGEKGGGLRMLGSRKAQRCQCTKKRRGNEGGEPNCQLHCNEGWSWDSRIYWPEYMLNGDGVVMTEELKTLLNPDVMVQPRNRLKPPRPDNLYRLMKMASLRTSSAAANPEFSMPPASVRHVAAKPANPKGRKRAPVREEDRIHKEDERTISAIRNKKLFSSDHPWLRLFMLLVIRKFGEHYRPSHVTRLYQVTNNHPQKGVQISYMINIGGPGSNFCQNVNRDHRSNTVYFLLDEYGIVQRCHCKCDEVRPSGITCKKFTSEKKSLFDVPNLLLTVFPPMWHGMPWPGRTDRKWGSMPVGWTIVLWNRMTRLTTTANGVEDETAVANITEEDQSMTPELIARLEQEINLSKPIKAKDIIIPKSHLERLFEAEEDEDQDHDELSIGNE